MIRQTASLALAMALLLPPVSGWAQDDEQAAPVPEKIDADARPASVKVGQSPRGAIYTDPKGRTLYAMDMRTLRSRYGVGADYCKGPCAEKWAAFAAPESSARAGRWTVVKGAVGPQWAWNGNPVFTYIADTAAGSIMGDGFEDMWNVIGHVPPAPQIVAPAMIKPAYGDGAYRLVDADGHLLFAQTSAAPCTGECSQWQPLQAGLASHDIGEWRVSRDGDRPRWLFKGQPVYVAQGRNAADLPDGTTILRP